MQRDIEMPAMHARANHFANPRFHALESFRRFHAHIEKTMVHAAYRHANRAPALFGARLRVTRH